MIGWDNFWKSSSNALWSLSRGIMVGDNLMANDLTDGTIHTRAAAIDILTHETAHAVITYDTELSLGTNNITGAINEGYADIFGCLKDHNWKIGENIYPQDSNKCGRNIANPSDSNANEQGASKISELGNYDRDIHNQSLIVSHAAYLMHEKTTKNGLTWDELGQVWYKSLRMGLQADASWKDVRRCVVWAAQKLKYSDKQLAIIKAAFDEVGIKEQKENFGLIYGTVKEKPKKDVENAEPLKNVQVTAFELRLKNGIFSSEMIKRTATLSLQEKDFRRDNGKIVPAPFNYFLELEAGNYHIKFEKKGYKTDSEDVSIITSEDVLLNMELKKLNSISGTVTDASDENHKPLGGVSVQISGSNSFTGSTITDSNGTYLFELDTDEAGDYNLTFSLSGYSDGTLNVHVDADAGEVTGCDVALAKDEERKISGVVQSLSDKKALEGVTVQLFEGAKGSTEKTPIKTAITDSNGAYSFELNENGPGDYTMVFTKTGYAEATETVTLNVGLIVAPIVYLDEEEIPIDEEHFPDENFRNYIKREIDVNNDNVLNISEIRNTTSIGTNFQSSKLRGIEYFSYLSYLACQDTQLIELDLSKNTALKRLEADRNKLTSLNISGCIALEYLDCTANELTELDVSNNPMLNALECSYNSLTKLDVSNNTLLVKLWCSNNKLTELDVSNHKKLFDFQCGSNQLVMLKVDGCDSLAILYCFGNQLTTLDASNLAALRDISCGKNQLKELKVNGCNVLHDLLCDDNQLKTLDVSDFNSLYRLSCENNQLTMLNVSGCNALYYLHCTKNQLTTLDVSSCRSDIHVTCDQNVSVLRPTLKTITSALSATTHEVENSIIILASISAFTPSYSGEYSFDVSLDRALLNGSKLFLLNSSEDLQGVFTIPDSESFDHVRVSANFEAGKTYSPVIAAQFEAESSGGGCNAEVSGVFALMFVSIIAKRRFR